MRKLLASFAVGASLAVSGSALADGYVVGGPRLIAQPYSWTGVYFGGQIGYGWGDTDSREDFFIAAPPGVPLASFSDSHSINGWMAGVHLGAMKQFGPFVIGTQLSLSGGDIDGSTGNCAGLTAPAVGVNCDTKVNWLSTGLGRAGFAWDRFLVYGSLGYAVAGVDHSLTLNVPAAAPAASITFQKSDVAHGIAFGGGLEYAVTRDFTVAVDYLRANLQSDGEGIVLGGSLTTGKRDVDLNVVSARLSYRFGGSECCAVRAPLPLK